MKAQVEKIEAKASLDEFSFNAHATMFIFYGVLFSAWLLLQATV